MKLNTFLVYFKKFLFASLLLLGLVGYSQQNTAFKAGEILRYKGSYILSGMWTDIAELKLEVSNFTNAGKQLYSLKATANTYTAYDSFFKIRDLYQAWVDINTVKPYMYVRDVDEGGYKFNIKYVYKRATHQAKYDYTRNGVTKTSIIPFTEETFDLVSVMYHVRTLNMEGFKPNQIISLTVLIDGKLNKVTLKYKGKETIKIDNLGNTLCHKFGVATDNKALQTKETNAIWLTADARKIPVLIKAEIPVGAIQVRLVEALGTIK